MPLRGSEGLHIQARAVGETAEAAKRLEQYLSHLGRTCSERAFVQYADGSTRSFADQDYGSAAASQRRQEEPSALDQAETAGAWNWSEHREALHLAAPVASSTWRFSYGADAPSTQAAAGRSAQGGLNYAPAPVAMAVPSANGPLTRPVAVEMAYETLVTASSSGRSRSPERQWRILGCTSPTSPSQTSPSSHHHGPARGSSAGPRQASAPRLGQEPSPLVHPLVSRYLSSFRRASPTREPRREQRRREEQPQREGSGVTSRSPSAASGGSPPYMPPMGQPSLGRWHPLSVRDHAALDARAEALTAHLEGMVRARVEALWHECTVDSRRHVLDESVDLNQLRDELVEGAQAEEPGRRAEALRRRVATLREAERALFAEIVDAELFVGRQR